ncbi:MAG: PP0621 family protein [Azoarcus sp.]|nr:PP0621 family protein [Azoarcus sp.]
MRNLLIFLLLLGAIWWVRRALTRPRNGASRGAKKVAGPERMLACAHCGVNVPESEGVRDGEVFFCCETHRSLGDAGKGD